MAWSHLYGTISSGGANALLPVIRDFMLSVGWELADDYITAANPFFAMRSTGESGTDSFAVMIERDPLLQALYPTVCKTWESISSGLWVPGAGAVSCATNGTFTKTGAAPDFNTVFTSGDLIYCCNNVGNASQNIGRMKANVVGTTTMSVVTPGYPYNYSNAIVSNSNTMITKGGPWNHARSVMTTLNQGLINASTTTYYYYLFGDKDSIFVITRKGTTYYISIYGRYTPYHQETIAVSASEMTSGVSTSVNVADGSLFQVNMNYEVANDKNGHVFRITSIVGNTLNFTGGLTGGITGVVYPVGSKLGEDVVPYCVGGLGNTRTVGSWDFVNRNDVGLNTHNIQGHSLNTAPLQVTNDSLNFAFSPDLRRNQYGFTPMWIYNTGDVRGPIRNIFKMYTAPGNSEDTIRLSSTAGPTYKIFYIGDSWYVIKE